MAARGPRFWGSGLGTHVCNIRATDRTSSERLLNPSRSFRHLRGESRRSGLPRIIVARRANEARTRPICAQSHANLARFSAGAAMQAAGSRAAEAKAKEGTMFAFFKRKPQPGRKPKQKAGGRPKKAAPTAPATTTTAAAVEGRRRRAQAEEEAREEDELQLVEAREPGNHDEGGE